MIKEKELEMETAAERKWSEEELCGQLSLAEIGVMHLMDGINREKWHSAEMLSARCFNDAKIIAVTLEALADEEILEVREIKNTRGRTFRREYRIRETMWLSKWEAV